jgi:hypothetical protein
MSRARARALLPSHFPIRRRVALLACALAALLAGAARADAPTATRSEFPDRRFGGVTTSDAALCGAGLATDPGSSFYGNPALALVGPRAARVSGGLLLPARDDLRASTTDFADASGFAELGEIGGRLRFKGLGVTGYFAQPHYAHEETRFVGFDPTTGVTTDPFVRKNNYTSATRYGGLGIAARLANGVVLGVAGEAVALAERYTSVPETPPGIADTSTVDRAKTVLGGAVGLSYTARGLVALGASYHRAGNVTYDGGGTDDAPAMFLAGVRVGRTAGSAGYAGARLLAHRDVDLAETGGAAYVAPARREYSAGYAYDDPAGTWFLRIGGGASPRPDGGTIRLSRFGAAFGVGSDGGRVSLSYAHTGESRSGGRPSSVNQVLLTVEVRP